VLVDYCDVGGLGGVGVGEDDVCVVDLDGFGVGVVCVG